MAPPAKGEELVPVGAEQLDPAAVQVEAVEGEPGLAEPGPDPVLIDLLTVHAQLRRHRVQRRVVDIPQPDVLEPGQHRGHRHLARSAGRDGYSGRGDLPAVTEQPDRNVGRARERGGRVHRRLDHDPPGGGIQDADRLGVHVGQERPRHHPQPHIAVDPAWLPVVHRGGGLRRRPIRRHVEVEGRIEPNGQHVPARP
jgi:hypothetical protein